MNGEEESRWKRDNKLSPSARSCTPEPDVPSVHKRPGLVLSAPVSRKPVLLTLVIISVVLFVASSVSTCSCTDAWLRFTTHKAEVVQDGLYNLTGRFQDVFAVGKGDAHIVLIDVNKYFNDNWTVLYDAISQSVDFAFSMVLRDYMDALLRRIDDTLFECEDFLSK